MLAATTRTPGLLLILTVPVVGALHTAVPDHWVPITLMARQRGWSNHETARAALQAASGHVVTTLIIGVMVWLAGVAFATRFGHIVGILASIALVSFGGWIAIGAWRELHRRGHDHGQGGRFGHSHAHYSYDHGHGGGHGTGGVHGPELQRVNTGHGTVELSIFEDGVHPRFRFTGPAVSWVHAETPREGGVRQDFTFANKGLFWESVEDIPEPHGFHVYLALGHGAHNQAFQVEFVEHAHDDGDAHRHHGHSHDDHGHDEYEGAHDALYARWPTVQLSSPGTRLTCLLGATDGFRGGSLDAELQRLLAAGVLTIAWSETGTVLS